MKTQLARNLKILRKIENITVLEMSKKLKIGHTTYKELERGVYDPNTSILLKIRALFQNTHRRPPPLQNTPTPQNETYLQNR